MHPLLYHPLVYAAAPVLCCSLAILYVPFTEKRSRNLLLCFLSSAMMATFVLFFYYSVVRAQLFTSSPHSNQPETHQTHPHTGLIAPPSSEREVLPIYQPTHHASPFPRSISIREREASLSPHPPCNFLWGMKCGCEVLRFAFLHWE